MEKKFLIPTVIGVLLLSVVVFTVVYKKTSNEPNNPTPIETVAPKETQPIESKVAGENNNLKDFNVNETKTVYVDEQGDVLSEEEAQSIEESEIESIAQLVEQASISAESVKEEDFIVDESKEDESFSQDEFSEFQSNVSMKISELTAQEAVADMRIVLKSEVKKYAPEHPELQEITPEMIDNYNEEELYKLYGKISEIIGY